MTNFDKWKIYTDGLPSPNNYLDWSWFYTISASLQRRVWLGPPHQPCYPNMYCILVGPPGVGKGLAIREVTTFLKHWPLDIYKGNTAIATSDSDKATVEMMAEKAVKQANEVESQGSNKKQEQYRPLLIPVCADAITYEALVMAVGNSYRCINYVDATDTNDKPKLKIYGHSSLCFVLQELSSLMRKRTNDTVNYLLGLYECPVDYEYSTVTRGKDRVRRGCLNIIAGTTPSFMQSTFDENLIGEGFTSRTFYIYANKNRKNMCWLPALSTEQEQYKKELLEHIKKLTTIYGPVKLEPATMKWMQDWWDDYEQGKLKRSNNALEMVPYYSRKNIHTMKLAMALHFSEDAEQDDYGRPKNPITIETFERAIKILELEERNMHLAIALEGNNPVSKATRKILDLLRLGKKNFVDIYSATFKIVNDRSQLEEVIAFLELTDQITQDLVKDETTQKEIVYWRLK